MNKDSAQTAVSISAFLVAGIYVYRRLNAEVGSSKPPPSAAHFLIGFGFTYITLAILAAGAPALGGMFAILVGTGDALVNGQAILADVQTGLGAAKTATSPATTTNAGGG
jgi:hypothetical protein